MIPVPVIVAALELLVCWHGKRSLTDDALLPAELQEHEIAVAMRVIDKARADQVPA